MKLTNPMVGLACFIALLIFRYFRLLVAIVANITYKPKPVLENPKYTSRDVSVIIPTTFKVPEELVQCVHRILCTAPAAIFIVTANKNVPLVENLVAVHTSTTRITVLGVAQLNKRHQILKALDHIETKVTVLADDDVFWPDNYLSYLLAIFEDPQVGAGGTRQRVRRNEKIDFWNFLGISYLERRVWNNCATNAIDGSLSTLSGRTAAYLSSILQDDAFKFYFMNDTWRGKPLNSDDDKCLTRYVYSKGWKIVLQFDPRSVIETTVEGNFHYLDQCLRWARAHWRGNFTVMENETYWRSSTYWWGAYYIYACQYQTPAFIWDGLLFVFLWLALSDSPMPAAYAPYLCLAGWIFLTKNIKMTRHFWKYPQDMRFIPVGIFFSYAHGFLNLYARFSMKTTHWGSQNLSTLQESRAEDAAVVPLLKETIDEPSPGLVIIGDDYFAAEDGENSEAFMPPA